MRSMRLLRVRFKLASQQVPSTTFQALRRLLFSSLFKLHVPLGDFCGCHVGPQFVVTLVDGGRASSAAVARFRYATSEMTRRR